MKVREQGFVCCLWNRGAAPLSLAFAVFALPEIASAQAGNDDGQWRMPSRDYQATRFSGLDEINLTNAAKLKVAWTFSTGINRGQEAAPIVVSNTMYVITPFPNILYALDLK